MTRTAPSAESRRRIHCSSGLCHLARGATVAILVVASAASAVASDAPPRRYEFVNIADNTGPLSQFIHSFPAINNSGTVVFDASYDGGGRGLFTGDGRSLTTLIDGRAGGPIQSVGKNFGINDAGRVAARGVTGPRDAVVFTVGPDRAVQILATGAAYYDHVTIQPQLRPVLDDEVTLNEAGAVAFSDRYYGRTAVMVARDDTVETVIDRWGTLANVGRPVLNDRGAVAFGAIPEGGTPGVYVVENGTLRRVAGPELSASGYYARLDMNDHGVIAVPTGSGIVRLEDGAVTPVGEGNYVSINNHGDVAIHRQFAGEDTGIFTGPDVVADKVVRWGDPLFDSQVRRLTFFGGPGGINDRGDVVFKYELADGREGVAVARAVPEPAAVALLALLAPTLLRRRSIPPRSAAL